MPVKRDSDPVDVRSIALELTDSIHDWTEDLAEIVSIDSGSDNPTGVNRVLRVFEGWLGADGWALERRSGLRAPDSTVFGDALVASMRGTGGPSILLLGHADTVFADGTASERPLRIAGPRALGPGVCDMKGGLLVGASAVRALRRAGFDAYDTLTFLITPDEEVGSPASRGLTAEIASRHDAALVLEAARESGAIVSARKGNSFAHIRLTGRAAHAGVEPERGRNALLAAARLLVALQELNGRWPSGSVNVGVLTGGSRANVVPSDAKLEVDIRAGALEEQAAIESETRRLAHEGWVDDVSASIEIYREHSPMERSAEVAALVDVAIGVAAQLGFDLTDEPTGGASDANEIAALGVPVLDGLGPIGGDDHSEREWIDLDSVPSRVALLAGIVAQLCKT